MSENRDAVTNEADDESTQESKKKEKSKQKSEPIVNYSKLFRYMSGWDYVLLVSAFLGAFLQSLVYPVAIVVYSELVAMFIDRTLGQGTSSDTIGLPLFGGGKIL